MSNNQYAFEVALYNVIKRVTDINIKITSRQIKSILEIRRLYISLKKQMEETIDPQMSVVLNNENIHCLKELTLEIEKSYSISVNLFKSLWWGEFSNLNSREFPELYSMMTDQNGDLLRSYDDFNGTVATMDFHGYTQFSKDIKYNKTPLLEFGDILPQKIEQICNKCKSLVYEMEGDALIVIGPENPIYIFSAVLSIIELCRQKPFKTGADAKKFHNIEITNPMIKPFEINAAITTGGRTFINKNGHIIGSIISEASRILKIINTKKPHKSGIIVSDKIYRKLNRYKNTNFNCHISVFDFTASDPFIVDVKGTRLHIKEIYLEKKKYIEDTKEYNRKLAEEIKKKNPSKWHNILSYFLNIILAALHEKKIVVQNGAENLSQDRLKHVLQLKYYEWTSNPTHTTINNILKLVNLLYNSSEDVRDITAVYHEFIQENYKLIAARLEDFYKQNLQKEGKNSPAIKKLLDSYDNEFKKLEKRFPAKRILGTILADTKFNSQMRDIPYMGKK